MVGLRGQGVDLGLWATTLRKYISNSINDIATLQACRPEKRFSFLPAFVARILTPRLRKSGYGLLLRCRLALDSRREFFFGDVETKKPSGKIFI